MNPGQVSSPGQLLVPGQKFNQKNGNGRYGRNAHGDICQNSTKQNDICSFRKHICRPR